MANNASTKTRSTQPMYGGKIHRVTGDIKDNMTGKCLYKMDGEWNGQIKFTDEASVSTHYKYSIYSYWSRERIFREYVYFVSAVLESLAKNECGHATNKKIQNVSV